MAKIKGYQPTAYMDLGGGPQWHRVKLPEATSYVCATEQQANETISRLFSSGLDIINWEIVKMK